MKIESTAGEKRTRNGKYIHKYKRQFLSSFISFIIQLTEVCETFITQVRNNKNSTKEEIVKWNFTLIRFLILY